MRRWSMCSSAMRSATGSREIPSRTLPVSWFVSGSDPLSRLTERELNLIALWCDLRLERVSSGARAFAHRSDPHTRAIADRHQGASADPLSTDNDIDRLVGQWPERQQGIWCEL